MDQTNINILIDSNLKNQADILFGELGMSLSTAVNIFIRQSLREGKIPFEISANQLNLNWTDLQKAANEGKLEFFLKSGDFIPLTVKNGDSVGLDVG